jgi:hypothetical protein
MKLPGRTPQPKIKEKTDQKPAINQEVDQRGQELTFDEMKVMGQELKDLREGGVRTQLKDIGKMRTKEDFEKKKKKKKMMSVSNTVMGEGSRLFQNFDPGPDSQYSTYR